MKKIYGIVLAGLAVLDLIIDIVFVWILPDNVPIHWSNGVADGFGSKYTTFLFFAFTCFFSLLFLFIIKRIKKKDERITLFICGVIILITMCALSIDYGMNALNYIESVNGTKCYVTGGNSKKMIAAITGIILIIICIIIPFVKNNSWLGNRTKWSMYNDNTWVKSQKYTGISGSIVGLVIIGISFLVKSDKLVWGIICGMLAVWAITCIAASYLFYKKEAGKGL